MRVQLIATSSDCPGDDCPALMRDADTGDVFVQGYTLSAEQLAGTTAAGGALPTAEGRLRIPGAVFEQLIAQHRG